MPGALHIFRAGTHQPMHGAAIAFSEAMLADMARVYDPAKHEAPIVVGHPRHDAPAYGWVAGLTANGNELTAEPSQVDPAFGEMVASGRYKKISASFYAPDAPSNPVPGHYYLRHVGFLGAQPPAVKGLKSSDFADDEAGVIAFADDNDGADAAMPNALKRFFLKSLGLDTISAPTTPATHVTVPASTPTPTPAATTAPGTAEAAFAEELGRLRAQIATLTAAQSQRDTAADTRAFAECLVSEGRLTPKDRPLIERVLDALAAPGSDGQAVAFTEGDTTLPALPALRDFLSRREPVLAFSEQARAARAANPTPTDPVLADAERRASAATTRPA